MDTTIIAEAGGIIACLVCSALFSGSETALTSLSGPQAQQLVDEGGSRALKLWVDRPIHVLTAILIGNNIVNITASALATDLAQRALGGTEASDWAIPMTVGIMTFLLLTFGEITPKALAKRMAKRLAGPIMVMLRVPIALFYPFTLFFSAITRFVMRLLGDDPDHHAPFITAEEIEYMIDLGSREGTFPEERERMLRGVLEFNDTVVREIMIPRTDMISVNAEMDPDEMFALMIRSGHSRIPVYEESIDNIIGIFYVKDLLPVMVERARHEGEASQFEITEHLRKPFFVPESKRIGDLFGEFQRQRIHMAIVVDEFGGTDGIITLEDIIEEFFGEIQDEYDTEPEQVVVLDERTVRVDARASIVEIGGHFNRSWQDDPEYDTIGGFLMAQLGNVPGVGDELVWDGLRFRVMEADEKRVISVLVELLDGEDDGSLESLVS